MIFWTYSFAVFKNPGYLEHKDISNDCSETQIDSIKTESIIIKEKIKELNDKLKLFSKSTSYNSQGIFQHKNNPHNIIALKKNQRSLVLDEEIGIQRVEVDGSGSMNSLSYNIKHVEQEINELLFQNMDKQLFCFTCNLLKHVRAKHCRKCARCIKRFDHHCPWTGNCVGKYNHKFFIQFLFYASFTLVMYAIFQVFI